MEYFTNLHSFTRGIMSIMDLCEPEGHNFLLRVSYLSNSIAKQMNFKPNQRNTVLMRVIGKGMLRTLNDVGYFGDISKMFKFGKRIIKLAPSFEDLRSLSSKFSYINASKEFNIALYADNIIYLSEEIVRLLNDDEPAIAQAKRIMKEYKKTSLINNDVWNAFKEVASKECTWMDLVYNKDLVKDMLPENKALSLDEVCEYTKLISLFIDYRSPFTAMHSAGVSETAVCIAEKCGFSEEELKKIRIAGDLHDLGKLRVPREIIEKNGKLTDEEFDLMKEHVYYSYQVLSNIEGFEEIAKWAAYHHEKLNGMGYPFGLQEKDLPLASRIMSVADIFSAISEKRPYRDGMKKEDVIKIMKDNVSKNALKEELVNILLDNYDEINRRREEASKEAGTIYFESIKDEERKKLLKENRLFSWLAV